MRCENREMRGMGGWRTLGGKEEGERGGKARMACVGEWVMRTARVGEMSGGRGVLVGMVIQ